jgi:hypothetical protein
MTTILYDLSFLYDRAATLATRHECMQSAEEYVEVRLAARVKYLSGGVF